MNKLMQNLEDAKRALTEAMNGTDAEAIKSATEAVKAAQAAIDAAKEGAALLKSFGQPEGKVEAKSARTLGEFALKNLDLTAMRAGSAKSAGTGYGFKAGTDAHTSTPITVVDQNAVDTVIRNLEVRRLFGSLSISGNAYKYFVLGAKEGSGPAVTAEGAAKPQFHIPYTPATATLSKVAGWYYETDELIEDNALLRSSIDDRGLFELDNAIEAYLMTTLLGTSGLGAATYTHGGNVTADDVFKAMMAVKTASGYNADAIVINPTDYQILRLAKDQVNQYYGGGAFYGPYGNTALAIQPGLWGLNTVVSTAVTAGTILVGNFKQGASVITKEGDGQRVEIVTGDHDDRVANRVTVIVEERLALATRVPSAFVKITEAAS